MVPEEKVLPRGSDKTPLLETFRDGGFLVLDVSYQPINDKKLAKRKLAIKRELPRLVDNVRKPDPPGIVIVKCSLYKPMKEALEKAGFGRNILNKGRCPSRLTATRKCTENNSEALLLAK